MIDIDDITFYLAQNAEAVLFVLFIIIIFGVAYIYDEFISPYTSENNKSDPLHHDTYNDNSYDLDESFTSEWDIWHDGKHVDPESYWGQIRSRIFERDGFACTKCGSEMNLTIQHIRPVSLGGTNDFNNLKTLCANCHEVEDQKIIFTAKNDFGDTDNYGKNVHLNRKIDKIYDSIMVSHDLNVSYTDAKGITTKRCISPERLFYSHGKIYLRAFCHLRDSERTFRISRIKIEKLLLIYLTLQLLLVNF